MIEWTAGLLAARLALPLRGDESRALTGAAPLDLAGPSDLSFAGAEKVFQTARASKAACLIAPPQFEPASGQTVIASPQPRAHFAQALALFYPARPVHPGIHPTALIEDGASIDGTAEIGAFVSIGQRSQIGAYCRIGGGCAIGADVTLGDGCVLHPRVSI